MNYMEGERANSKGHRERQSVEHVKYTPGYNKIKKGATRTVLLLEMLKHGRVSSKDWLKIYKGKRGTPDVCLTTALANIPDSIAPYDYKEGKTLYVDCLRRERIQDLLDAWYKENETTRGEK